MSKILYISEVPVELSYAGATLVYRLFEQYPKDKLLIVQTSQSISNQKLTNVKYVQLGNKSKGIRLLEKLKLYQLSNYIKIYAKQRLSLRLKREISKFRPDFIVTVTFNLSWLTAYRVSLEYEVPLLLLLHDDFLTTENYGGCQPILIEKFREVYLYADACFCIGPQMEQHYNKLYNKKGLILYPLRGKNDITFVKNWDKETEKNTLNYCYAGSIGTSDFLPMLNTLAKILLKSGHTLTIFSKVDKEGLKNYTYLLLPHVHFKDMVHPDLLKKYIFESVHVNVLLNSFEHEELFKLNFSSKIVDYTAVNLPVLFWGSATSGIISWAIEKKYSCVVIENSERLLEEQVDRLQTRHYRRQLADQLQTIADETFGYTSNYKVFTSQLNG